MTNETLKLILNDMSKEQLIKIIESFIKEHLPIYQQNQIIAEIASELKNEIKQPFRR